MRRRALLAVLSGTVAGCLGSNEVGTTSETDTPSTVTRTPLPLNEPVRCRGEAVAVTAEYSVDIEDEVVAYFPENGTVRIVASWSGDEVEATRDVPAEEWVRIRGAKPAAEKAHQTARDRLGTDEFGFSVGTPPDSQEGLTPYLSVWVDTSVEDPTPPVSLSRLADVGPRSVETTVTLADLERTVTFPVYAELNEQPEPT